MALSSGRDRQEAGWNFDNSYARLPEAFYVRLVPVPVPRPELAVFNAALARSLGLNPETLKGDEGAAVFAGNRIPEGAEPLAQAYAGHQFGGFTISPRPMRGISSAVSPCWATGGPYCWASR